jgi:ribosomal protein L1
MFDSETLTDTCVCLISSFSEIKHPVHASDSLEVCLFVKDPQREVKDKIKQLGISCISKVIGISKLRQKYAQYEAKRQLCSSFDVFLADNRIIAKLPHLIGKVFFVKKKTPLVVDLRRGAWEKIFRKALRSTPFFLTEGTCARLLVGNSGMSRDAIIENILSACQNVAKILPKEWHLIQSLHIKTHDSIALPIYNSLPVRALPSPPHPPPAPFLTARYPAGHACNRAAGRAACGVGQAQIGRRRRRAGAQGGQASGPRVAAEFRQEARPAKPDPQPRRHGRSTRPRPSGRRLAGVGEVQAGHDPKAGRHA